MFGYGRRSFLHLPGRLTPPSPPPKVRHHCYVQGSGLIDVCPLVGRGDVSTFQNTTHTLSWALRKKQSRRKPSYPRRTSRLSANPTHTSRTHYHYDYFSCFLLRRHFFRLPLFGAPSSRMSLVVACWIGQGFAPAGILVIKTPQATYTYYV
jgi:hypothetical protein